MAFNAYSYNKYKGTSDENTERRIQSARSHSNFQLPPKQISEATKNYNATSLILSMSVPKDHKTHNIHIREGNYSIH